MVEVLVRVSTTVVVEDVVRVSTTVTVVLVVTALTRVFDETSEFVVITVRVDDDVFSDTVVTDTITVCESTSGTLA